MDTIKIDMFLGQSESKGQIEGEVQLAADKEDVGKIYNVYCNVNVREKTIGKDSVHIGGEAEFTVYYLGAGGLVDSFFASAPFTHEIDAKGIEADNEVSVMCRMEDVGAGVIDARNIKLMAKTNFLANIYKKSGIPELRTEGLQTKRIPVDGRFIECSESHSFHITEEMRIPGGMEQVETVVGTKCYGVINGIKKDGDKAVCFGDIYVNTIYSSGDGLWQINDSFPFEEIVESDVSLEEKEIVGDIVVKKATATAYDPDVISYSVSAVIKLDIMSGIPEGMIVDAYSLTHHIETVNNHINMKSLMGCDCAKYTLRESTKTGGVEKPVCLMAAPHIKSEYAMDGAVNIEGNMMCDIIYRKEDGTMDCVRITVPFDESVPVAGVKEEHDVWTEINVEKITAVISGEDMELRFLMDVCVKSFKEEEYNIVERVEEKEPLDKDNSSVMIYFKDEDEELFDVAKRYHVAIEDIDCENKNKLILINPIVG